MPDTAPTLLPENSPASLKEAPAPSQMVRNPTFSDWEDIDHQARRRAVREAMEQIKASKA